MALFEGNKRNTANSNSKDERRKIGAATIITEGSIFEGNIHGNDSVHIDGHIIGDVVVHNGVIIGKSGIVEGDIKADRVIISGKLSGSVECEDLEIMNGAIVVSDKIDTSDLIIDGRVDSVITTTKSVNITANGYMKSAQIMTDSLTVDGFLYGRSTSTKFLEITIKGEMEANLVVETLKIHKGGRFIGNIAEYPSYTDNEEKLID